MNQNLASFEYVPVPTKAVFGPDCSLRIGDEAAELGVERLFVICSKNMRGRIADLLTALGDRTAGIFDGAEPHCPESVAKSALAAFLASDSDCVVVIGGGSTIGLGKYIKLNTRRPMIIAPTTPCGSESTPIHGVLSGSVKRTGVDRLVIADIAFYDPLLTTSLSPYLIATIGMNALAHCVEALYAEKPNPVAIMFAEDGINALTSGIRATIGHPESIDARAQVQYGGMLSGYCVNLAGIAIHHKICHVLGGNHGIPHGESNSVILPYAVAYNEQAAPHAMEVLKRILKTEGAASGLYDFAREIGVPVSLKSLGMKEEDLDAAARETVETTRYNPRPVDVASVRALLEQAYHGIRPA